jgi:hypothetical protein
MLPHQERVVAEKADLDEKREKLITFIGTNLYQTLPEDERHRLSEQCHFMNGYSKVLGDRITAFVTEV